MHSRRGFLKGTAMTTAAVSLAGIENIFAKNTQNNSVKKGKMKLSFIPYTLELAHVFTLSTSSRTSTPDVLTRIELGDWVGYGEASMPPYLGESIESVCSFLSKVDLSQFNDPMEIEKILDYVDAIAPLNKAAKASVDIALHDLVGKMIGLPWWKIWGYDTKKMPFTSFTIGIDKPDVVRQKTKEAAPYKILKVKLGRDTDKELIETIRSVTDKPICVDVNQGWTDKKFAVDMSHWLAEKGVVFIEQGMPKEKVDDNAYLTENSPIPTIADEAFQRLPDLIKCHGVYSGINIKLMKSTGLREGHRMLELARALNMKVMIGCMTETSCGISAAAQLAPMVDWADLDGNLLIKNDAFSGVKIIDGKVTLNDKPGLGVTPLGKLKF